MNKLLYIIVGIWCLFGCRTPCTYSYLRWVRDNTDSINYVKTIKNTDGKQYIITTDTVLNVVIKIEEKE